MDIEIKQVNLKSSERAFYSKQLQIFEENFKYALGEEWFKIIHGMSETEDYFSFFEQMGDVYYFTASNNGKIVGAACAILRNGNEGKYWYLCDVKVLKEFRGKGILEKIFRKYFFKCVFKSRKMMAVNMGNGKTQGNGLLSKLKRIFWMFNVNVSTLNFHTWNKADIPSSFNHVYTNFEKKDLLINNKLFPLYHLSEEKMIGFKEITLDSLDNDDNFMICISEDFDIYSEGISGKGIMISIGLKNPRISTMEI